MFKTLNVIQTSQVEEYKQKYAFSFHPTDSDDENLCGDDSASLLFDEDLDDIFGADLECFDPKGNFDDFDDFEALNPDDFDDQ